MAPFGGLLGYTSAKEKCANEACAEVDEEAVALLHPKAVKLAPAFDLSKLCMDSLNVFKGIMVVFMTWAHTDLALLPPAAQYYYQLPHFIGNAAASLCFLGFMLSYGFSCDFAYLSDWKERSASERFHRMFRSAAIPVGGAWVCAFAWGWMCFKLPLDQSTLINVLDFRLTIGNGPDFLLCFSACIVVMYLARNAVNFGLRGDRPVRCILCAIFLLLGPLALTKLIVTDCTGMRKYYGYFFECTYRDAWSPVLPAFPHLFYFNIGLLLARLVRVVDADLKAGALMDGQKLASACFCITVLAMICCYPLATVWANNYGNLSVPTKWGPINRGFVDGPSVLWLLGNVFPVFALLALSVALQYTVATYAVGPWFAPVRFLRSEVSNLGANVLLYLVMADILLAGLYRGNQGQFPLDTQGCFFMVCGITGITRFLQFLVAK